MNEIVLGAGVHDTPEKGMCAMEFVAWIANEPHTDRPECVDPLLAGFMAGINDSVGDEDRQRLKPYLGRCIGTRDDGHADARRDLLAGLDDYGIPARFGDDKSKFMWAFWKGQEMTGLPRWEKTTLDWPLITSALEQLLPTEELSWVPEAIREKVGRGGVMAENDQSVPVRDLDSVLSVLQEHVHGCREEVENSSKCWKPAEFVIWGKLLPNEALGPRCYDHAVKHVGHHGVAPRAGYAVINLRDLAREIVEADHDA